MPKQATRPVKRSYKKRVYHGLRGRSEYGIWAQMKDRCSNTDSKSYAYYGGRGIAFCERWKEFTNFLEDMGERPSMKHTLDRINNDGNYELGNCRWATKLEQMTNTRFNNAHPGVSFNKGLHRYYAYIRGRHLGSFRTLGEALNARKEAEGEY